MKSRQTTTRGARIDDDAPTEQPPLFEIEPAFQARSAVVSTCGKYRYSLSRRWAADGPVCVFVMLNPSTADADHDDPTIRRCIGFAHQFDCAALHVVNLYAYRATDPRELWKVDDPVGADNEQYLSAAAELARESGGYLIMAWGGHARPGRAAAVTETLAAIQELLCLGTTVHGQPRHPLFLPKQAPLVQWAPPSTMPDSRSEPPAPPRFDPVPEAVIEGVKAAGWPGIVLPQMRMGGYLVYPVVDINRQAWDERLAAGHGPELERSTLKIWEGWAPDLGPMPPPTVLSITGLVSTARPQAALNALTFLGGAGGGLIVATGSRGPSRTTLMECDIEDIGMAWVPAGGEPRLLVKGRDGPVATARRITLTRHAEEELFQWALTTEAIR
ncbi:DUF1643 domain-containing protein [Mycobacteroides chelonae]|uniref:DUF1643 domain-containing protein n=1 Tax=Mycobacteroides chelonae TaxID=1774 RepID=UPI000B0E02AC|nr:DUF1643 domain-containing protein [Mycobacteroides chelonae]